MIKVIGVFDKVKQHKIRKDFLQDFITEEIASTDFSHLPCPVCGGKDPVWKYLRSKHHPFIWDDPDREIHVLMPQFSFRCKACGAHGIENVSTDLTIDRTRLSYHYLFFLFRLKRNYVVISEMDLSNTLYGKLCEESLRLWIRRYKLDFQILQSLFPGLQEKAFLSELVPFEFPFLRFYEHEKRFFMQDSSTVLMIPVIN